MTALDERPDRAPGAPLGSRLTGREFQVLRLIALGRSDGEIAAELFLTRNTVRSHLRRIFARLGAHTRANAVAIAYHRRILLLPGEERRPPLPDFTQAEEPVGVSVVAQALLVREWAASGRARRTGRRSRRGSPRRQTTTTPTEGPDDHQPQSGSRRPMRERRAERCRCAPCSRGGGRASTRMRRSSIRMRCPVGDLREDE